MVVIPEGLGIIGSQADRSAHAAPHIALGCRAPREFRNQLLVKTTATAIGAMRRSHGGASAAETVGSSLPAGHSAETLSVWLDASALCFAPVKGTGPWEPGSSRAYRRDLP
jgi:hypothetical protein